MWGTKVIRWPMKLGRARTFLSNVQSSQLTPNYGLGAHNRCRGENRFEGLSYAVAGLRIPGEGIRARAPPDFIDRLS